jgi:TonB family protein
MSAKFRVPGVAIIALLLVGGVSGALLAQEAGPPYRVGGEVSRPEKVAGDPPAYTEMARRTRVSGVVIIEAIIDEQGNITDARVLKGLPMGLDKQAVDAVQTWKFKPAMLRGKAVSVYYVLTVNFQVSSDFSFGPRWSELLVKTPELAEPFRAKRYEEAAALLDRWIAERPKDAGLHFARSYVLMAQGRMTEALAEVKTYDGPDSGELFYYLALNASNRAYEADDSVERSDLVELGLEAVDRAVEAWPDDADALSTKVALLRHKASLLSDDNEDAPAIREEADRLEERVYELRAKKQPKKGT